jgi:hypothetical protein
MMFILYGGVPLLIRRSSATIMNLSFLTSDFWSLLSARFLFNTPLTMYYFVSFAVIVLGLAIYHMAGGSTVDLPGDIGGPGGDNGEEKEEETGAAGTKGGAAWPSAHYADGDEEQRLHESGAE